MRAAAPLADKLEKQWDNDLFGKSGLATMLGWESHWTFVSKGSRAGFPDRTLARDRVIFAELKRELTGRKSEDANRQPTIAQIEWLDRLARAGGEVYLWRPSDLDEIARILSKPWQFQGWSRRLHASEGHGTDNQTAWWTPGSLWMPGIGRLDSHVQQTVDTEGKAA